MLISCITASHTVSVMRSSAAIKEPVALSFLYEQIELHKKAQANKWRKEKIRQTLQINPMHFTHDGRDLWSLNRNAA